MIKYTKEQPGTIEALFNGIATRYDKANAAMSLNLHHKWNRALADKILSIQQPRHYLDLCSGTGEIPVRILERLENRCEVFFLDFSENMLALARKKTKKFENQHILHTLHADAQNIPLPSDSFDVVTIAYGIRNIQDPSRCLSEVYRVLKKRGVFGILELTRPENAIMKMGHQLYMKLFLPLIGKWLASDKHAYRYLCNSVQEFLSPKKIEEMLQEQGFQQTQVLALNGGIATLIIARKSP